jgi:hypothetical protein
MSGNGVTIGGRARGAKRADRAAGAANILHKVLTEMAGKMSATMRPVMSAGPPG